MSSYIIVPAPGMNHDLARKLVENDTFVHMWLVHPNGQKCPDGCDGMGSKARRALYCAIRVYQTRSELDAYKRGQNDSEKDRAPIFRKSGKQLLATVDDSLADEWSTEQRQAYLDGYDALGISL